MCAIVKRYVDLAHEYENMHEKPYLHVWIKGLNRNWLKTQQQPDDKSYEFDVCGKLFIPNTPYNNT